MRLCSLMTRYDIDIVIYWGSMHCYFLFLFAKSNRVEIEYTYGGHIIWMGIILFEYVYISGLIMIKR